MIDSLENWGRLVELTRKAILLARLRGFELKLLRARVDYLQRQLRAKP